jgi:hypothetical protein
MESEVPYDKEKIDNANANAGVDQWKSEMIFGLLEIVVCIIASVF